MTSSKILKNYNVFLARIKSSFDLVDVSQEIKDRVVISGPKLYKKQLYKIIELSFLEIFLAWEKFLEDSLIDYLLVKKNSRKFHCYIRPRSVKHILEILQEGRLYADFANTEFILRVANTYFRNGEPFNSSIRLHKTSIDDIKTIRNAIAHDSSNSMEKFQKLVRRHLGTLPRGATPGSFLYSSSNPNICYLKFYADILEKAAHAIVY
jgi:hypothetical protein